MKRTLIFTLTIALSLLFGLSLVWEWRQHATVRAAKAAISLPSTMGGAAEKVIVNFTPTQIGQNGVAAVKDAPAQTRTSSCP
jgi:hypothetical protein